MGSAAIDSTPTKASSARVAMNGSATSRSVQLNHPGRAAIRHEPSEARLTVGMVMPLIP